MRGRYFRYLFENLDGNLFHTGSIYDKERQKAVNYIYMVESCGGKAEQDEETNVLEQGDIPETIDVLVVASYTVKYIERLIDIVGRREVKAVVLPYLAPIQRLVLVGEMKDGSGRGKESARFLQDPYVFLKEAGVENVFFLFGNGKAIHREPEELDSRFHFEKADPTTLQLIREMEGYEVPVVRAGYMKKYEFFFYFGIYGLDLKVLSEFTREYFSHPENIDKLSENASEDYASQMKRLIQSYLRKFGNSPETTITMFAMPLHTSIRANDSFMTQKEFESGAGCSKWGDCQRDGRCCCMIKCTYGRDHDNLQRHKRGMGEPRFGILMLGNVNLNRYLSEIMRRYSKVIPRIRGIGVPNCGSGKEWNHQMLRPFIVKDRIYWICLKHDITSAGVVSDIVLSAASNRLLPVDAARGCCLSGYIIPKEDED